MQTSFSQSFLKSQCKWKCASLCFGPEIFWQNYNYLLISLIRARRKRDSQRRKRRNPMLMRRRRTRVKKTSKSWRKKRRRVRSVIARRVTRRMTWMRRRTGRRRRRTRTVRLNSAPLIFLRRLPKKPSRDLEMIIIPLKHRHHQSL